MAAERPDWLHRHLPHDPRPVRLPGMAPLALADWLRVDEAYCAQMVLRDGLVARHPGDVIAETPGPAGAELLALVLERLADLPGFTVDGSRVTRPDGVRVDLGQPPLHSLARLCQNDFCVLERQGAEHVLTGAALCFPAHWTLAEKLGRPLIGIHRPVASYDADLARRVQRLFDALRPGAGLWRHNALKYVDPALHHPGLEDAPRKRDAAAAQFLRSERQCLVRLPESGAVVFSIHTYLLHRDDVPPEWWSGI